MNSLRPRKNGRHFADDIFKCIFLNENVWILIRISLKFVPQGPINNIPALVQIMAWRRRGNKPLFGPMMVRLPMHICITRPQWVNRHRVYFKAIYFFLNHASFFQIFLSHQWFEKCFPCSEDIIQNSPLATKSKSGMVPWSGHDEKLTDCDQNLSISEGDQNILTYPISGHSIHVFSRKCQETSCDGWTDGQKVSRLVSHLGNG